MNRSLICAAASVALSISAAEYTPVFFSENFQGMTGDDALAAASWITRGTDSAPTEALSSLFNDQHSPYILWDYSGTTYAMSCASFVDSAPADQWLISPAIEISADAVELSFTAALYNNSREWGSGNASIQVLVSESGTAKDAFIPLSFNGTSFKPSSNKELTTKNYYVPLEGYAGKTVHIAFVNNSTDAGMTGFTNISLGNYAIEFANTTDEIINVGEEAIVQVNVGMKTPVACPGFTATLKIEDGSEPVSKYYKKNLGGAGTSLAYQFVEFEPIRFDEAKTVGYSVEILPDYEGAPASAVSGILGIPAVTYPSNVVIEELTATGCGWCPAGTASLAYYSDTYPGDATTGKAIPVAIHGYMNYYDPMNEGVEEYCADIMKINGISGLPQAIFNRSSKGLGPDNHAEVERQIAAASYNLVEIGKVTAPDAANPWLKDVNVEFAVRNAFSTTSRPLRAAAILVEDNVSGNDLGYMQTNYFYNHDDAFITSNYGSYLVPYMQKYLQGGELGMEKIPFNAITYSHVARGIYPSFTGEVIASEWVADESQSFNLSFKVPQTVKNLSETAVVIIVTDENGAIVASDALHASEYAFSGISTASISKRLKIYSEEGKIIVNAPDGTLVSIFAADGKAIASGIVAGDTVSIDTEAKGLVVVKASGAISEVSKIIL